MANSSVADVIELGSSDEDTEPVPKKQKLVSKPMVHIPSELPGITIKPAGLKVSPVSSIGEGVTVTKVPSGGLKVANPFAIKTKLNGKPILSKPVIQPSCLNSGVPVIRPKTVISPFVKKIGQTIATHGPIKIAKGVLTSTSISPRPLQSRLPPGITVKRTNQTVLKHGAKKFPATNMQVQRQNFPPGPKSSKPTEMVCVDLDDDDPPPSSGGPQWYLRPEDPEDNNEKTPDSGETDETETSTKEENIVTGISDIETQNNKEPEPSKLIEITIEDSPSKPPKSKRLHDMNELAITIEDSPVKSAADQPKPSNSSDNEATTTEKDKQSKKKLEYPYTAGTVEIEIELTPVKNNSVNHSVENYKDTHSPDSEIVEIEESPLKPFEIENSSTPKKKNPNPHQTALKLNNSKTNPVKSQPKVDESKKVTPSDLEEFNSTYQTFINLCFQFEDSDDMRKIVEKKIKTYYRQVPKEYTESEAFIDMVASKISAVKAAPDKMYLYIKDVVDELNMQRKLAKAQPPKLDIVNEDKEKILYGEESEFDLKRQRQIRKLEKTLKKLHRAIQKLEEQEVDFDDEEDSVYLLTESEDGTNKDDYEALDKSKLLKRYKERLVRVHAKFCQLTNTRMPSEPRVQIDARPGQPKGAAKRLEKWINKKVPIGTPLPFPDFHDVLRCVRDANQEDKLGWNEADIMEEARDLFTRCGKKLQRRRQENEWRLAASRIQAELDPAEESEDLKKKLDQNRRDASVKENEVLKKFADRQNQLNLEAVEIGDKEANESPVETDEEEPTEETPSLETKEKRKERLKRLIQEKSTKPVDEKEQHQEIERTDMESEKELASTEKEESNKDNENKAEEVVSNKEKESTQNDEANDTLATEDNKYKSDSEKVHSLSDESSKIDSDIDELHLLQKLHSDVVDSSTLESSDTESQIDTLSSGDNKKRQSDVISIENSSYSESEKTNEPDIVSFTQKKVVSETVNTQMEIECSIVGVQKKINKTNNDEYNDSVEDLLLASSDDEAEKDKAASNEPTSVSEINIDHAEKPETQCKVSPEMNVETTDASSMDSIEMTTAINNNLNENMEITSISSTENGDSNIKNTDEAMYLTNSVESVQSIDVEPKTNDLNEIDSFESKKEESNIVEDELDRIISITNTDKAIKVLKPVHSVELVESINVEPTKNDTVDLDSSQINHRGSETGEDESDRILSMANTDEVINSVESVQSSDVEPTNNDTNEFESAQSNHGESKTTEDEADRILSMANAGETISVTHSVQSIDVETEKNSSGNSTDLSENVKSLNDFAKAKKGSLESASEAASGFITDKDTRDEFREANSRIENKTSGEEDENEKCISKAEMEPPSNNDENETSKKEHNVKESTIQSEVGDLDVKAVSKGVAAVEPMEVDAQVDNT